MIALVDYGAGNVGSLLGALRKRNVEAVLTADPQAVRDADAAILPGDGAFGATMTALRERALLAAIVGLVEDGKPFLGICVGMQILYEGSDEFGASRGLGILAGKVRKFTGRARVPHIGWTKIDVQRAHPLTAGLGPQEYAYFLHSHFAPLSDTTVASAFHEDRFSAVVASNNVMGAQFHPEKSRYAGDLLLRNFIQGIPNGNDPERKRNA